MIALSAGFDRHAALGEQADEAVDVVAQPVGHARGVRAGCAAPASAAATEPGVFDAVKMSGSASSVSSSIASAEPIERAAARSERLRERDGDEVDVVEHAVLLGRAAAALAEHAEPVGLVVEEERVRVATAQLDHLGERGGVAAHRVDAVDDRRPCPAPPGGRRGSWRAARRRCARSASSWRPRAARR